MAGKRQAEGRALRVGDHADRLVADGSDQVGQIGRDAAQRLVGVGSRGTQAGPVDGDKSHPGRSQEGVVTESHQAATAGTGQKDQRAAVGGSELAVGEGAAIGQLNGLHEKKLWSLGDSNS